MICALIFILRWFGLQHWCIFPFFQSSKNYSGRVFGAPLDSLVSDTQTIPLVCERLMDSIERTGLYVEGVYRKSGAAPKVKELKAALENGEDFHNKICSM